MVDLTDPSPLVMTRFELISTVSAFTAVAIALAFDLHKAWLRRRGAAAGGQS